MSMKKIFRFIIRFILKLIPAVVCTAGVFAYLTIHYTLLSEGPGQDLGFEYIEREIYVNGCHIYNFQLTHPVVKCLELAQEAELFGRPSKEDDQISLLDDEDEEPEPGRPVNTFKVAAAENWLRTDLDADNLFIPLDSSFQDMLGIQILTRGDLVQIIKTEAKPYQKPSKRDYVAENYSYFVGTPYIDIDAVLCRQFMNKGSLDLTDSRDRLRFYINNYLADHFERFEDRRQEEVFIDLSSKDFYWCQDIAADSDFYVPLDEDRPGQLLYVRLSALEAVPEFGISSFYDPISGIYISSFADRTAEQMYSENNALYMTGRAEYMKNIQRRLDTNTAYYMEYLFRKYAVFNDVDEELLIGLCRTESAYTLELNSTAIGIMQLMPNTVRGWGWSVEDVQSLEGNISFGSMYIKYMIDQCGGDRVRALSAYNQGLGRVRGGSYETWYANRVLDYRQSIFNWCRENGYSEKFLEVTMPELFEEKESEAAEPETSEDAPSGQTESEAPQAEEKTPEKTAGEEKGGSED